MYYFICTDLLPVSIMSITVFYCACCNTCTVYENDLKHCIIRSTFSSLCISKSIHVHTSCSILSYIPSLTSVIHSNLFTLLQCEENYSDCPMWFGCNNHTYECNTEPEHIIKCDGERVLSHYCPITTDEDEFSLLLGSRLFKCWWRPNHTILDSIVQYYH